MPTNLPSLTQTNLAPIGEALRDIKPPVEIMSAWTLVAIILGVLAAIALLIGLIILIVVLIVRKRRGQLPPIIPPHERAKLKLNEALRLISQPKPYVIAISDALRCYLEERFDFHAPERTTEEFLHEMQATHLLNADQKQSLTGFLQHCDLVKFAQFEPVEQELRELHRAAYGLVEETEPVEEKAESGKAESGNEPPADATRNTQHATP